jgi:hypothetical protein
MTRQLQFHPRLVCSGLLEPLPSHLQCPPHNFHQFDEQRHIVGIYSERRWPAVQLESVCNNPWSLALTNKLFRTSITITNSIEDNESPCRRPCWCLINTCGCPLSNTLIVDVVRRLEPGCTMLLQSPCAIEPPIRKPKRLNQRLSKYPI